MKNKIFYAILGAGALAFFFTARAPATNADAAYDGEPELVAATFASAWCSACKVLKPRVVAVMDDFAASPVSFIELDFTFGERDDIRERAVQAGFAAVYDRFKGATGFTLLIDAETGEVIDTLTMNHSRDAMRQAIAGALAEAGRTQTPSPEGRPQTDETTL